MGTDIHAFIECADPFRALSFSGTPEWPAYLLGTFSLLRDYELFDALGDGSNSLMLPEEVEKRALFPPREFRPISVFRRRKNTRILSSGAICRLAASGQNMIVSAWRT